MIRKVPAHIAPRLLAYRLADLEEQANMLKIRLLGWTPELRDEGVRLNGVTMWAYNDYMAVDPMLEYSQFDRNQPNEVEF